MKAKKPLLLIILAILFSGSFISLQAQSDTIEVVEDADGWKLLVNNEPLMVNGMNWDYFPIGTNFNYSIWDESPEFIQEALDNEMGLLQNMGVNAIRVYTGIPKEWIEYIYDNYGIYTMLNHSFGRYGLTIDGSWMANTEYSDERVRNLLLSEVTQLAQEYQDTRGSCFICLEMKITTGCSGEEPKQKTFQLKTGSQPSEPGTCMSSLMMQL